MKIGVTQIAQATSAVFREKFTERPRLISALETYPPATEPTLDNP